jgi:hypothetical protein
MAEITQTNIIPIEDFTRQVETGLFVLSGAESGLQVIDCGDVRPLTDASERHRSDTHGGEVVPGRYFGGSLGLGMSALIAVASQADERFMQDFAAEYGPEAFATFAVDLSRRAQEERDGLEINLHSAEANEGNDAGLDLDQPPEVPLGCKFAVYAGSVLMLAGGERAFAEARTVMELTGQELPLEEAREGARLLGKHLPSAFSVGRDALRHAASHNHGHMPHAVLKGDAVANDKTALVIDMAGYRSSARRRAEAGQPRYHHTPDIASRELPSLLPEYRLDEGLVAAGSLLLGTATREALSGPDTPQALRMEVIPHEYALAA